MNFNSVDTSTDEDCKRMEVALHEARTALQEGTFPVGAALYQGDYLIGSARKRMSSARMDHAEMTLFNGVFAGEYRYSRADRLTLYTTLEPCSMCFGTLLHLPISRLVYAMEDAYGGCASHFSLKPPPRNVGKLPQIVTGIRRDEARDLFRAFLSSTRESFWSNGGAPQFQDAVRE